MAQLAILGHATRGKEVIEILEMLGGKNEKEYNGENNCLQHHINERNEISVFTHVFDVNDFIFYTLEEFLGKFPYKVGDKVQKESATSCGSVYEVTNMEWNNNTVEYTVSPIGTPNVKTKCLVTDLRFLEEQNSIPPYMDYDVKGNVMVGKGTLVEIDLTRELDKADVIEVVLGDYEFVLKDGKTYFVKKKPKYLKTYEECCKVLELTNLELPTAHGYGSIEIESLQQLLVCRDAYWKILGDWKYDVNKTEEYFYIVNKCGRIVKEHYMNFNHILAFPTEEIRDSFYGNFKELIEECKALL